MSNYFSKPDSLVDAVKEIYAKDPGGEIVSEDIERNAAYKMVKVKTPDGRTVMRKQRAEIKNEEVEVESDESVEEIEEKRKLDPVDSKELKGKHSEREDGDIDNDGDEDESDEYLHKRRKAVKKNMDEEVQTDADKHRELAAAHKEKMLDAKDEDHRDGMTAHRMAHDAHMAAAKAHDKAPDSHTATAAKMASQKAHAATKKADTMFESVQFDLDEKYTDKQKVMKTAYQSAQKPHSRVPTAKNIADLPSDKKLRDKGYGRTAAARNMASKPGLKTAHDKAARASDQAHTRDVQKKLKTYMGRSDRHSDLKRKFDRPGVMEATNMSSKDWLAMTDNHHDEADFHKKQAAKHSDERVKSAHEKAAKLHIQAADHAEHLAGGDDVKVHPDDHKHYNKLSSAAKNQSQQARGMREAVLSDEEIAMIEAKLAEFDLDEARGRPRKDGSQGNEPEPDEHFHVQIKKVADYTKPANVIHKDGSKSTLHPNHAKAIDSALHKMKPNDREKVVNHMHASPSNLKQVVAKVS